MAVKSTADLDVWPPETPRARALMKVQISVYRHIAFEQHGFAVIAFDIAADRGRLVVSVDNQGRVSWDTDILPLMLAKLMVQDAPLGTVMLPLTVVTIAAPPKVRVQFVSARAVEAPPRSDAAARASVSVKIFMTYSFRWWNIVKKKTARHLFNIARSAIQS